MKRKFSTLTFFSITLLMALMFSCSPEDGEDGAVGPQGPQGEQGIQGPAGADGADGTNGTNGADGADGADGANGNANVSTYLFDLSDRAGASFSNTIPDMTSDVIENDLIIGYLKRSGGSVYSPIPSGAFVVATGNLADVSVDLQTQQFWFFFYNVGTSSLKSVPTGSLDRLKVVIAESTSTSGKSGKSGREQILANMKSAGVDINDYYAVMDYFGLDY
ncbi:MAG: hypothetical protein AB3N16_05900 [Flavobacteriaceae bacterium]